MEYISTEKFRLKNYDTISVVVVEKKLFSPQKKRIISSNEAFYDENLFHHGIMFRLYTSRNGEVQNVDNFLVEIGMEATITSIAPNIDHLDDPPNTFQVIEDIIASEHLGGRCSLNKYVVNVRSFEFLSRYKTGYFIANVTNKQFQKTLSFIDNYESIYGPVYNVANVVLRPDSTDDTFDMHSYLNNMRRPYIHDNNCYSLVSRILNQLDLSAHEVIACFLPDRNYVSHFVTSDDDIVRIDTSTEKGIRAVFLYYKKLRQLLKLNKSKTIPTIHSLLLRARLIDFDFIVCQQWNPHLQKIDFYQIKKTIDPFVGFAPYQIEFSSAERSSVKSARAPHLDM